MIEDSSKNISGKKNARILTIEESNAERLKMTVEQRFDLLMKLIKLNKLISKSKTK